jgi:polygalacturonase
MKNLIVNIRYIFLFEKYNISKMKMYIQLSKRCLYFLIVFAVFSSSKANADNKKELKDYLANLPFSMFVFQEPNFPTHHENILQHGAIGDGLTMNTRAFAKAIKVCAEAGGGTVEVPPGTWLTGPIKFENNINLHLELGALIQFSNRIEDFPLIAGFDGKSKKYQITPPISGYKLKNIAITGDGIFDGAGEAWRPVKKEKQTTKQWKELVASGGAVSQDGKIWWPSKEAMEGENYIKKVEQSKRKLSIEDYSHVREYLRPHMVQFIQCKDILLDGPTFRNSPKFHVYPVQSENIIVRNVKILTPWYAQNGDGLDLSACRNVVVYKTTVDVGDDAICIKPGKISDSQKPGPACENIVIADCIVYRGHGGFVIGSESYGNARNISVRNCVFIGTDVGLRFKSSRGRGGLVDNIFIEGIQMRGIENEAILFDMYYGDGDPESQTTEGVDTKSVEAVTDLTPKFENFFIKNVVCNSAKRAILINGLPEMPVKNIFIENVNITANRGVLCVDSDSIMLKNVYIASKTAPAISINQSRNIYLNRFFYPKGTEVFLNVNGDKCENIQLEDVDLSQAKKEIEFGEKAKREAVVRK